MKLNKYACLSLSIALVTACGPGPEPEARAAAEATPAPRPVFEVPAGAHLAVIVNTAMSSRTSQEGDAIEGSLAEDLLVNDHRVAPAGSPIRGRVTAAVPSGRVKTRARLAFVFDTLVVEGGKEKSIDTEAIDITADDTHNRDALIIGGGAGAGAAVGAIIDGGKGAGLGALIGAGAGTGVVLIDKGKNINIRSGGTLSIELTRALKVVG